MKFKSFKFMGVASIIALLAIIDGCSQQNQDRNSTFIPRTDTVIINLMKFSPDNLKAHTGDTVLWINKDIVAHNVKETENNLFFSDTLHPGDSFRWIVTANAEYICSIHPTMEGKITILKR